MSDSATLQRFMHARPRLATCQRSQDLAHSPATHPQLCLQPVRMLKQQQGELRSTFTPVRCICRQARVAARQW